MNLWLVDIGKWLGLGDYMLPAFHKLACLSLSILT